MGSLSVKSRGIVRSWRVGWPGVAAIVLSVSACGGEAGDARDPLPASDQIASTSSTASGLEATTSSADAPESRSEVPPGLEAPPGSDQNEQLIDLVIALLGVADPKDAVSAFAPTPDQQEVKECVQAAGFEYFIYVPLANDPSVTMPADDYATTWGLGITAQALGTYPQPSTEDIDYLAMLSEGQREAYETVVDECVDAVGFDRSRNPAIQSAAEQFRGTLTVDPRLQSATETWSRCMSTMGYDYVSPDAMRQDFYSAVVDPDVDLEAVFDLEVQTSLANLTCEPAYRTVYRDLVVERFGDFFDILDDPLPPDDGANG